MTIFLAYNELLSKEKINYERQYFILKYLVLFFLYFYQHLYQIAKQRLGLISAKTHLGQYILHPKKVKRKLQKNTLKKKNYTYLMIVLSYFLLDTLILVLQ